MSHMPHLGETVLVHHKDCHTNGARVVPAIVNQIVFIPTKGDDRPVLLNLLALPPFSLQKQLGSVPWYPSTPMIADESFVGAWPRNTHHEHIGDVDTSGDQS
jgi:hypothetical protein